MIAFFTDAFGVKPYEGILYLLIYTLVDIVWPVLVFAGAYFYAVKGKRAGITLLIICSVFSIIYFLYICLLMAVSWSYTIRWAIIVLAPIVMTLVTALLAAAVATRHQVQQLNANTRTSMLPDA